MSLFFEGHFFREGCFFVVREGYFTLIFLGMTQILLQFENIIIYSKLFF